MLKLSQKKKKKKGLPSMGEFLVVGRYITYLELMFKFYQSLSKFHKKKDMLMTKSIFCHIFSSDTFGNLN